MACEFFFRSVLPRGQRKALEDLFFFNLEQHLFLPEIEATISLLGPPEIQENGHGLNVQVARFPDTQNLFCFDRKTEKLLAIMMYFRSDLSELEIFHIAVSKKPEAPRNTLAVFLECMRVIKSVAKQIQGVNWLTLPYGRGRLKICSSTKS
jgi:hypothetical protein